MIDCDNFVCFYAKIMKFCYLSRSIFSDSFLLFTSIDFIFSFILFFFFLSICFFSSIYVRMLRIPMQPSGLKGR